MDVRWPPAPPRELGKGRFRWPISVGAVFLKESGWLGGGGQGYFGMGRVYRGWSHGGQVGSRRQGRDPVTCWIPTHIPKRQILAACIHLVLCCTPEAVQNHLDPMGLLMLYMGKGKTFPLPYGSVAAAPNMCWINRGIPASQSLDSSVQDLFPL